MLMPDKHIRLSESLFGFGGFLLGLLSSPKTIDELWTMYSKSMVTKEFPSNHTFENLVFAVDVLYSIGAIELHENGVLEKCV